MSESNSFQGKIMSPATVIMILAAACPLVVYALTAYREVTWWKNAEYLLVCHDLGVAHPPGSVLATLLGWIFLKLTPGSNDAFTLNLFAGILASVAVVIVAAVTLKLRGTESDSIAGTQAAHTATVIGAVAGGLTLAFGQTLWLYAVKYTPYVLTPVFTGLILSVIVGWYNRKDENNSDRWLFLMALLLGLDFSVHRTNMLLAPGILFFVLICRPEIFKKPSTYLIGALGLVLGLAVHLLIIPMAAGDPYLNSGNPDTLSKFWDYISLRQFGGGFLVGLWPRKAPFFSVQLADYLRAFSVNFFSWQGRIVSIGLWPGLLGVIGIISLWRQRPRLAQGLLILFLCSSLGAVIYFNVPDNFIRSMYRHYLPSFVIFALFIGYGVGSLLRVLVGLSRHPDSLVYSLAVIVLLAVPGYQLWSNYGSRDFHRHQFTADWAENIFATLPENSVLICYGDNDTHPLWYFQGATGKRPDIAILNINLMNTAWYMEDIFAKYPDLPFDKTDTLPLNSLTECTGDTITLAVAIDRDKFQLADTTEIPDSIQLYVGPDIAGKYLLGQSRWLLDLVKNNHWQRPIYFSVGGFGRFPQWLSEYLRPEGLALRLVPVPQVPPNWALLKENLMVKYRFSGYNNPEIQLDDVTRQFGINYLSLLMQLGRSAFDKDDGEELAKIKIFLNDNLPPERLEPLPPSLEKGIEIIFGQKTAEGDQATPNDSVSAIE